MENYIKKVSNKINQYWWTYKHKQVKKDYIKRYSGKNPTIISCNCIGGIIYNELDLQFLSPTINLYMNCEDFIKFCENMEYYLSLEIKEYDGDIEREYPLGMLDDLILYFVHYNSLDEAREKWNSRKKRMNMENIFIIANDRDGFNIDLLNRFSKLPYKNKKMFTHLSYEDYPDVVYLKGYENESQIEGLMYRIKGGYYLIDQFDWVEWLNNER